MKIEIDEIKQLLPHRDPFLFLDWCEIIEIGKKGKGYSVCRRRSCFRWLLDSLCWG